MTVMSSGGTGIDDSSSTGGTARAAVAGATVGLLAAGAESLRPSLTPRSTLHQSLVTTGMGTVGAVAGAGVGAAVGRFTGERAGFWLPAMTVGSTGIAAILRGRSHARAQAGAYEEWGTHGGHPALGALAGTGAAAGLAAGTALIGSELRSAGAAIAAHVPGSPAVWTGASAGAAVGGIVILGRTALARVLGGLTKSGAAADPALVEAPADTHVTGGPGSLVPYDTLSREGRRFVNWRVTADEISAAGGKRAQEPVRVFVGVQSAGGITERVELALAELDRLDAWSKSHILAVSPAGTGYANSVPVEALEFLSDGDCASVSVQYGLLPSMFSLNKVNIAAQTFRELIERIRERIRDLPHSPQLLLYGESLGAGAAQHGLLLRPEIVDPTTAAMTKADAALFVGTPGGKSLRNDLLDNPRTVHVDRWQALPEPLPHGIQLWFLEHDADPVTRFNRTLMWRRPSWLGPTPRGRNIPDDMAWMPVGTWQQVLLDVAYATQAQSGVFRSVGHDYRADLAPLVAAAFVPSAMGRVPHIQQVLSDREVARDRRLAEAEGPPPT